MKTLALALLAILLTLTACTSPLDQADVRKAATDYFAQAPHEGDVTPRDVSITSIMPVTRDGVAGWDVSISGRIVLPGLPDGYLEAMTLFVDGSSGAVTEIPAG